MTYAEKITAADRELDLDDPLDAWRRVRALSPHIGAWAMLHGRRVTIWRARLEDGALRARGAAGRARQDELRRVPARRRGDRPGAARPRTRSCAASSRRRPTPTGRSPPPWPASTRATGRSRSGSPTEPCRWRSTLDFGIEQLGKRPVRKLDPPVLAALRLGAYQLAFTDQAGARGRRRRGRARPRGAPRARRAVHERRHAQARAGLPGARRVAPRGRR